MGSCYSKASEYERVSQDESRVTESPPSASLYDTSSSDESTEFEIISAPPTPRAKPNWTRRFLFSKK